MKYRQFDNNQNLSLRIILFRLLSADPNATASIYQTEIVDPETNQVTGVKHYVSIQSVLSDIQIENGIATPSSATELSAIARQDSAKSNASAIPKWVTWTEAEALTWLATNIGTPLQTPIPANPMTVQQIRAVLVSVVDIMKKQHQAQQAMARMLIALRDETWPNLAG